MNREAECITVNEFISRFTIPDRQLPNHYVLFREVLFMTKDIITGASIQRFAIILMLYGGFYEISYWVGPRITRFPYKDSEIVMTFALLLGIVGIGVEIYHKYEAN